MTASTSPQARLQPSAAAIMVRTSCSPAVATLTDPVKVSAISRPKTTSDARDTGSSTRARFSLVSSGICSSVCLAIIDLRSPLRRRPE
jgi:hypothetical protein